MMLPTKDQLLAAIAKMEKLVPAPRTLGRVLQLLRDPDSGLHEIAELISRDAVLAVEVLRCANSAYYSRSSHVADLGDAMQVIGSRETIRLVSLVATRQTTDRNLGSYGIAAADFWAESLFNGIFLETLAQRVPAVDAGEAYTAGLLRFLGRLAIDQALGDFGASLFWDGTMPLPEWERESVGTTQAEVGAGLLRKWDFPDCVVRSIQFQDTEPAEEEVPLVQAMCFTAKLLPAGTMQTAFDAQPEFLAREHANHPFAMAHHLTADSIAELLEGTQRAFISIRDKLYS